MKTKILLAVLLLMTITAAQNRTEIISGSENNLFELSLTNSMNKTMQSVRIIVEEAPEWVTFKESEMYFENIPPLSKQVAQFYFDVAETFPVPAEGNIKYKITDGTGRSWYKTYNLKVTPLKVFEVYQNYPNPFNPSTTIKYSIPQDAFVSIKVFNVLGERIAELVN